MRAQAHVLLALLALGLAGGVAAQITSDGALPPINSGPKPAGAAGPAPSAGPTLPGQKPADVVPTFNMPVNKGGGSVMPPPVPLPPGMGGGSAAPPNPVQNTTKVVPNPATTLVPVTQPKANPNVGTNVTTSSMNQPQPAVTIVPGTGGVTNRLNADTRPADANADLGPNGGMPAMPNFPPTPLTSELPGLGRAPGSTNAGKPLIVRSVAGVNDIVPISKNFPNRIATPFKDPVWVDQNNANIDKLHSSIFITPKGDRAVQLFITENNDPNAPVVQLTLIPRAIPGQTLVVQIEGAEGVSAANRPSAREQRLPDEYTDQMLFLLREVARNRPPAGYTEENLSAPAANLIGGIQALPEKRYSGAAYDIYRYRLRNVGKERITLTEQSFFQKGVRAVAFFPLLQISGGQETSVNIIVSKDGE